MLEEVRSFDWSPEEYASFGLVAQVSKHRYHKSSQFDDEALIELLDNYPREWLQAFTMGDDPCDSSDWKCVDINPTSTGLDLLNAVKHGKLWINVTHIEKYSDTLATLIEGMYEQLGQQCPHLKNPSANFSTLLLSSPQAQVYYHLDAEPNMLWHLRGQKKIWVYPTMDTHFVPQNFLEEIYSGEIDENLPYDPSFDQHAQEYLLSPGDVVSWPHNAPHRIVNLDMNVSLATSYNTPVVYKRQYVQLANRFVLRSLGINNRGMKENGVVPALKRLTYRVVNKIKPFKRVDRSSQYLTDLQVDPTGVNGLVKLPEVRAASFSSLNR